jgi:mono/diheme cytochrome c family protein
MRRDRLTGHSQAEKPLIDKFLTGNLAALFTTALLAATVATAGVARADDAPADSKPYVVQNGRVDHHVFNGYRRYGDNCLRCHGPDGAGSSYAPALVDSLKHMTKEQFENTVINGRQDVNTANQNVMPPFGLNPDVVENLDDIYGYLKARSDGVLGRGRPKKIGDDDDN